jgi:hypothetical protein
MNEPDGIAGLSSLFQTDVTLINPIDIITDVLHNITKPYTHVTLKRPFPLEYFLPLPRWRQEWYRYHICKLYIAGNSTI